MHNRSFIAATLPFITLLAFLAASPRAIALDPRFDKIVDDYFAARFAFRPSEGTDAGLHQYDDMTENLSRVRIDQRVVELAQLKIRLDDLEQECTAAKKPLPFDDSIDIAMLKAQIDAEHLDLSTIREWARNPMIYAMLPGGAVDGLIKRDFAPPAARLRSVIARERALPRVLLDAKSNLARPPKEFTDLAIRMSKGSVGFFQGSVAEWARQAAGPDKALLASFQQSNAELISALQDFATWIETDLKPRSTGSYALGEKRFLAKLAAEEMVTLPLPELLARGEANLAKDYKDFLATAKKIDPTKSPAQLIASLSDDHPTADDLIPSVKRSIEAARQYLIDKDIVTLPSQVRPRIEETPPYARSGTFASMSTPGPYETRATEAFYYVTPVEKTWDAKHAEEHLRLYNPPVVAMINVHEAYPGHFLQFLYAPKFPTKVRKLLFCGTNAEGWAHYCEQMMVDQGFGADNPKIRLAQLQEALLRDCRYVVGIKLHTEGWTVEQGAKLFGEKAFLEPANAFEESRRGAYNPTYLYYTFGKLEIQRLRDDYLALNKNKTLKDFHNAFVATGSLPIPLVRRILFGS